MAVRFVPSPSRTPFRDALRRQAAALAVLVAGLVLSAGVAFLLAKLHADAERAGFKEAAELRVARVHAILSDELHDLEAMAVLSSVTPHFDGEFFRNAARFHQQQRGAAGALIWIPYVVHAQRGHLEAWARSEGIEGYRISDRLPSGESAPAGEREAYFPNLYREPRMPGNPGLGVDNGKDPVRRVALDAARDSGRAAATGRIELFFVPRSGNRNGMQVYFPVYHGSGLGVPETVELRRARLRGFVSALMPAQDLVASMFPDGLPAGWSMRLAVGAGADADRELFSVGPADAGDALRHEALAGPGELRVAVTFAAPAPGAGRAAWATLAVGGALSLLLAMLAGSLKARRDDEREAEARIGALLEACPDAMVVKDSALRYRMVNRAFCASSGLAPAQVIGRTNEELFGEAIAPHVSELEEACSRTGQRQTYEFQGENETGSRWYEAVAVPLGEGADRDGSIVVTARDITARKDLENARDLRARDALRASEDRFRALALLASDWFWEQDAELRFLPTRDEESPATRDAKRLGDRPIGLRRWEIPGFAAAPAALQAHRTALERHEAFRNFEYSVAREDGAVDWFSASGEPLFGAGGAFLGYRGTARNITEDRRREERLRESEARFRALADMASDWYWEQDANCRFTYLGFDADSARGGVELGPRGAMGRARWELPGLLADTAAMAAHREAVEQRHEPFRDFEFRLRMEDGSVRWYTASGDPVFGVDGEFAGYRGTGRDVTERRRAVQLERELSEQRRAVLENLLAAIIVIDERGAIETFSRQAEAIFGYAAHEVVGCNVSMLVPEPYRSRHDGYLARYSTTGERRIIGATRELYGVRKDGSQVPIELGITEIVVDGRRKYTGMVRDLTARRAAQAALVASEERFRSLFENSPEAVIVRDESAILMANPAAVALLGAASPEQLVGHQLVEFIDAEDERAAGAERRRQLLEAGDGRLPMREYHLRALDGTGRLVEAVSGAYRTADGVRIVTTYRDVTEQRAARAALAASEDRFRKLFEHSPDAVVLHDGREIRAANAAMARMVGASGPEALVGQPIWSFFDEAQRAIAGERLRETIAAPGVATPMREWNITGLDGRALVAESSSVALSGEPDVQVMTVMRDITERREAEEAVRRSEARLREVIDLVPNFIFVKDRDGRYLMTNRACAEHFGCTPETIIGKKPEELGTPVDNARRIREADDRVRATGERVVSEHHVPRAGGGTSYFVTTRMPVRFSAEHPDAVLAVSIDVTEMQESGRRLREVMDLVPHFIFVKDRDGRYLMTNRAYAEYFGHTTESIVGRLPADLGIRPSEVEVIEQADARVRETGAERFLPEQKVTGPDGRVHTYSTLRIPFRFSEQHADAVLAVSIDITEIRESERRLREILDVVPHPIYAKDREGKYLLSNRAHAAFYGRTPEEIVGRDGRALAPNEAERAAMASGDGRVLETLASDHQVDVVRTDAAGHTRHMNLVKLPFSYYGGKVDAVLGISIDITELVEAHAKVRESLALLEATLESTDNGFLVSDAMGRIVRWNHRMLQLFEMPDSALAALEAGDREALLALTREVFADPDAVREASREAAEDPAYQGTYTAVLKDGRFVERYTQPMLRDGRPAGRVWSYRDVTARERERVAAAEREATLERRVDERTLELKKAVADLTLFTSAISHDLRAPLRAVGGFIDMAIEDGGATLAPPARRHLERVVNAVRNMNAMVEGLLALARQTRAPINRQPVDVEALVREVFDELSQGAAKPGAQVAELRVTPCPAANADPVLLRNVVQNLIGNALKYSRNREQPAVEVGAAEHEGRPAWFVRDNGAGFDPKYADKLFQPFGRLHSPREFEGTGIGLAAAQRILERHGGRIWADARPGEGATFWFTLS